MHTDDSRNPSLFSSSFDSIVIIAHHYPNPSPHSGQAFRLNTYFEQLDYGNRLGRQLAPNCEVEIRKFN